MATTVQLPDPIALRLDEAFDPHSAAEAFESLRLVALGVEAGDLRDRAIVTLAASDHPGRVRDLGFIVADQSSPLRVRCLAAQLLGRIDCESSRRTLTNALADDDGAVVRTVAQALGRIGDGAAVKPLLAVLSRSNGGVHRQARFALELIAHRLDLDVSGDADADANPALITDPGDEGRRFGFGIADPVEAQIALRSLARTPFGLELNDVTAHQIRCDESRLLLLFDARIGDRIAAAALLDRKRFAAVIARRGEGSGLYAASALVLTAPEGKGRLAIRIHQTNGTLMLAGDAIVRDDGLALTLQAVKRPGAVATHIEGRLDDDGLRLTTARTGSVCLQVRRPRRLPRAPVA